MSNQSENETICLQPHLLTKITLINLLEQKCMNIKHLNTMTHEQLVELYQRIALPLPQRKYKQNYRGKLLTKLQNAKEIRKKKSKELNTNVTIGFNESNSASTQGTLGSGDRLKPPPSVVSFEKKKIILGSGRNNSAEMEHIQIKRRKSNDKNGEMDDDQLRPNEEYTSKTSRSNGSSKDVLKRTSSTTKDSNSLEQEPKKKKEKKLITWP